MKLCQLFVALLFVSPAMAASVTDDLTPDQLAELNKGNLVVRSVDVKGGPWPRLIVYTKVAAPVSAVEGVFRDYAGAASYIPNLVSADVLAHPSPDIYDVRYTSKMPLVGQISNTVRNRYSRDGDALVVSWNLLESGTADESTGELRVEPSGNGSIIRYTNYVKPKSSLAVIAKSAALSEVKKTVSAIKAESEKQNP